MKRKKRTCSYLPDDCWESIFKFIVNDDDHSYLNSLSLVSKQFLSVTNSLLFSLTIRPSTVPFLKRLLKRFTNLTSLSLSCDIDFDNFFRIISFPPKKLTNLTIFGVSSNHTFPANGLQAFSQNITTLTCYEVYLNKNDLLLIADCFPLLKELKLPHSLSERLLVNIQPDFNNAIHSLLSKCRCIQHLHLNGNYLLDDQHVAGFSLFHCDLVSINLNGCWGLTESALLSLVRNCPSLSEIKMKITGIGKESVENSDVYPQLTSLFLGGNSLLRDEKIIMLASFFPNLLHLDLSWCKRISDGICQVLKTCCKIKKLNLTGCSRVKLRGIDIVVPQLEVLNLSYTKVDDKTLYSISKNCRGLLKLLLENCKRVTKKGVKHVVRNCTQLREISLDDLHLREINREFFSRHGCLLC